MCLIHTLPLIPLVMVSLIYFLLNAPLCFSKLFLVFSLLKVQQHFLSMSRGKSVINYHIGWTFEASASLGNFHLVSNSNISFETPNTKLEWPQVLVNAPFTYVSYTGLTQTNLKDCKQPWAQDFWVFISDSHYFFYFKKWYCYKIELGAKPLCCNILVFFHQFVKCCDMLNWIFCNRTYFFPFKKNIISAEMLPGLGDKTIH